MIYDQCAAVDYLTSPACCACETLAGEHSVDRICDNLERSNSICGHYEVIIKKCGTNETGQDAGIVMMNEIPDGTDMIGKFFGEGQGLTHQTTTALTKGVVEAFDVTGQAAGFIHSLMALGWQNAGIRLDFSFG